MNRIRFHHTLLPFLALSIATMLSLWMPHRAEAAVVRTVQQPSATPTNKLRISPPRIELDVAPGHTYVQHVSMTNDSTHPQDVTVTPTDFGASSDPRQIGAATENGEFGAGDWITPEISQFRLAPFERIDFDVTIDTPVDAPIGTNLGGLRVRSKGASGSVGAGDGNSPLVVDGIVEIFLTVAGPVEHKLLITGVHTGDSFEFGSSRLIAWDITFKNEGTVNEHVAGSVDVQSIFGTRADRLKIDPLLVLRGSTRTLRVIWHQVPWVGAFTPRVDVRGDDAREQIRTGTRTVVLPWWVFPLVALLVLVPAIWLWIARRRAWQRYLEAEDAGDDDDFDDPWDPASPPLV